MRSNRRAFLLGIAAATLSSAPVWGAKKTRATAVFVKNMHCETCAKKIARKLYTVPGVVKVRTNVKKNVAVITPQANTNVSPKLVWEAVEAATFQPVKVASPLGVFTKKPRR